MQPSSKFSGMFAVSRADLIALYKGRKDPEARVKLILIIVGIFFTPITMFGAIRGYRRAYERFMRDKDMLPDLAPLPPIVRVAMILGAILIWIVLIIGLYLFMFVARQVLGDAFLSSPAFPIFIAVNTVLSFVFMFFFNIWRRETRNAILAEELENERFGTARFASEEELSDLQGQSGLYIGNGVYNYARQGHMLTVAGTRGGKGVNLIIPNLLGKGGYQGSWVVIDPKGENAAITGRYQQRIGQNVVILDPWSLQASKESAATYNPLDLITGQSNPDHLADDATIIAEMIVPAADKGDQFFNDRARALITGMLIHLVTAAENKHLGQLWQWLRLGDEPWNELLADMAVSDNAIVKATAYEVLNVMTKSDKTFGSILSTAQQFTDFLKSPALQTSLAKSNFNVNELSAGKTTLYVIIPADKLNSHYQWLRLVVTTTMRAVIRNKNKRVTFILDEFAALGFISEIKTALSTYAGFNVTVWPILQSLIQLKDKYRDDWETFLGNTAVKQYFSVGDNFTADYLSASLGEKTFVTYQSNGQGPAQPHATSRRLVTPDEVRRGSGNNIFAIIEQRPPTYFLKYPYYDIPELDGRYDANPYYKL